MFSRAQTLSARGIAVVLMVIYHFLFDIYFYLGLQIKNLEPFDLIPILIARISAIIFIFYAGSTTAQIFRSKDLDKKKLQAKIFKRIIKLLLLSIAITITTYLFNKDLTIHFGIIHFLCAAIILSLKISSHAKINFLISILLFLNFFIPENAIKILPNFLKIALTYKVENYQSFDHFPLLPWLGVYWLGISITQFFRTNNQVSSLSFLQKIGKYSLYIYIIHQPLVLFLLQFLK